SESQRPGVAQHIADGIGQDQAHHRDDQADAQRAQQDAHVHGALQEAGVGAESQSAVDASREAQEEEPSERIEIDGEEQDQGGPDQHQRLAPARSGSHAKSRQSSGRDASQTSWPTARSASRPRNGRVTFRTTFDGTSTSYRTSSPWKTSSRTRPGQTLAPAGGVVAISRRSGRMVRRTRLPADRG